MILNGDDRQLCMTQALDGAVDCVVLENTPDVLSLGRLVDHPGPGELGGCPDDFEHKLFLERKC